mmetsp:Transcript_8683/g.12418  ORF Transcript_8683/g.12418 Transcript_8683/m.12418 type:complete len:241 (+) Transcript_8683:851-1573(+)
MIKDAIRLVKKSLQVFIFHSESSHSIVVKPSDIIQVLWTLGRLYLRIGSFINSTYSITKALQLARKVASEYPSDPTKLFDVVDLLFALGQIFHKQSHWQAALKHYHEALQVEEVLGQERMEVALVLHSLGQVYHELRDWDRAFQYLEHALRLTRLLGEQNVLLVDLLTMIGNIQNERGNTEDAFTRLTESRRILLQAGQGHNANFSTSLMSPLGTEQHLRALANVLNSCEVEFHPAAAAA